MTPAITAVRLSSSPRRAELPLVVLGAVPGIAATDLWAACARGLGDRVDLLAWDLPGQGHNTAVPEEPYSLAELAVGVLRVVDDVLEQRGSAGGSFGYVGGAVGGAVGLRLLLDAPGRIGGLVLLGGDDLLAEVDDPHLLQVAEEVGPLAPAEDPAATAGLIRRLLLGDEPAEESPLSERERALVLLAAGLVRGDAAPEHGLDTASAAAVRALLAPPSTGGG